jgi:hypothetical protein
MPLWHGKASDLLPFRQPSHGRATMITMIHLPIRPPRLPLMPLPFSLPIPPHHLHPHIQPLFPQHQMQLIFSFHLRIPIRLDLMTLMPMPMPMADTDAESDVEDISSAESPTTSQIERCTPSRVTLLIYSHADFSYIDDTWLPGSDDMMDTSENE